MQDKRAKKKYASDVALSSLFHLVFQFGVKSALLAWDVVLSDGFFRRAVRWAPRSRSVAKARALERVAAAAARQGRRWAANRAAESAGECIVSIGLQCDAGLSSPFSAFPPGAR